MSVCGLIVCVYFFFFKQKTAYEMRISDWSSDVCSSDLPPGADLVFEIELVDFMSREDFQRRLSILQQAMAQQGPPQQGEQSIQQIGRASCRERVCQYV